MTQKKRRRQGKTDYPHRIGMLKSGKPRVVFRRTNKLIIGQHIKSNESKDSIITGAISKELLKYGWKREGNLKSITASYLTGFLLGKKILDKEDKAEAIFDIGLQKNIKKSRAYGFLKGVIDAGIKINAKEDVFPDEKTIKGNSLKHKEEFDKIKESIIKKFV